MPATAKCPTCHVPMEREVGRQPSIRSMMGLPIYADVVYWRCPECEAEFVRAPREPRQQLFEGVPDLVTLMREGSR